MCSLTGVRITFNKFEDFFFHSVMKHFVFKRANFTKLHSLLFSQARSSCKKTLVYSSKQVVRLMCSGEVTSLKLTKVSRCFSVC